MCRSNRSWDAVSAAVIAVSSPPATLAARRTTRGPASTGPSSMRPASCGRPLHTDTAVDLSVALGSLRIPNPLIAASGCFGYGVEYADAVDLSALGGVAVKGLFLAPREGHAPPRIVETPAGMLNAIGLQGIGVHRFIEDKLPELRARR